jgi:hypothetical protein
VYIYINGYEIWYVECQVDNIKMDLRDIGWDGVDWMDMDQDREQWRALVDIVLNLRVS